MTQAAVAEKDFAALRAAFDQELKAYFDDFAKGIERRPCLDQYVGDVDGTGYLEFGYKDDAPETGPDDPFVLRLPVEHRPTNLPPVILVLESPHIHEFPDDKSKAPQPASRDTGWGIRRRFGEALRLKSSAVTFRRPLILMNAIQFQCSAGVNTAAHRNAIFQRMWKTDGVTENFRTRLRDYMGEHSDAFVVNACTAGGGGRELRRLVEDAIYESRGGRESDLRLPHPQRWVDRRFRDSPITPWKYRLPK